MTRTSTFKRFMSAVVCALATACATDDGATSSPNAAPAAAEAAAPALPDGVDEARLRWIEQRGREIYERDRAAWVATDAALEAMDLYASGAQGWISESAPDGWKTIFLKPAGDGYAPVFTAWSTEWDVTRTEIADADAAPVPDRLSNAFRARQAALKADIKVCSNTANTVVVPIDESEAPGAFDVYVLSATTETGVIVIGGHQRVRVDAETMQISEFQPFSKGCTNLKPGDQEGGGLAALVITHLLADTPEETHVFASLSHGIPFVVITTSNEATWMVEDGAIRLVSAELK